jgi:hypothetical protein
MPASYNKKIVPIKMLHIYIALAWTLPPEKSGIEFLELVTNLNETLD